MEKKHSVAEGKWGFRPGPILFAGPPASCQGYLELINKSDDDVEPKAITITRLQPGFGERRLLAATKGPARLGPHQHLRVPIEVSLDPTTPPGTYTGQLSCSSQTEDVVINVLESWDLRIVPQSVTITASPGERVALGILFTNLGNIEVTLPNSLSLYLEHNLEISRHLNAALKTAGKQGFNKLLDQFVQELTEAAVSDAVVQFKLEGGKFSAGETREVELQIQLPEDLKRNTMYKGVIKFENAKLVLDIECTGARAVSTTRVK
jgi:hypothetical protein